MQQPPQQPVQLLPALEADKHQNIHGNMMYLMYQTVVLFRCFAQQSISLANTHVRNDLKLITIASLYVIIIIIITSTTKNRDSNNNVI